MSDVSGSSSVGNKRKGKSRDEEGSDEDTWDSDEDDDTIARIQRAHFAQAAAMRGRRRSAPRPRPMTNKRKLEAVKQFHDFTKKLKKDTGVTIRSLVGNNVLELSDFSSEDSKSDSDGLSEEEFVVNPNAVEELNQEDESYIDPETGDFVQSKKSVKKPPKVPTASPPPVPVPVPPAGLEEPVVPELPEVPVVPEEKKTLSISDIISDGDLDLTKNVEISEVEESELCPGKTAEDLLDMKQEENSQDFDITEKLKEMGEISVKPIKKDDEVDKPADEEKIPETEEDKKQNTNALNMRRNIRDVMDEKNLDASTLAAQRQESERLARVQEQQRIIREVQRQIAINRQNKIHQKTLSLLQGGSSLLKKGPGQKLNLPNTVLVKLPSGEMKKTTMKQGQVEVTKIPKPTTSGASLRPDQKTDKKEVVEIVDSSSGDESSSATSDSDDCIMLSDSEVPRSPEAEEDPNNSGLHVNDAYNQPDEQGRVLINLGHPENEEDIFLAPQIARVIKPHQIGGVRFLFDNIIESVERFSTSTGFGCILAHSMGLGKTLQIVCFCDIFLRHTSSKTVLCIMPINTLQNWVAEFNMWLPTDAAASPLSAHGEVRPRNFPIYVLNDSHKTLQMRAKVVKDWKTTGGVLMIGYELYRLLSMKKDKKPRKKKKAELKAEAAEKEREEREKEKNKEKPDTLNDDTQGSDNTFHSKISDDSKLEDGEGTGCKLEAEIREELKKEEKKEDTPSDEDKKLLDEMYEALVRPGPDLVICDEGHRIKNSHSNISYALKQMRTKRRVVLTGYPLQNNLLEYWCMVDFVRPNYLGSKTEFCNMFERPIQNGQCIDSTPQDIRLMRYRAHVLHSLLVGFVQRRSHAVLQSTLPQKEEYVLLVRMTPLQRKLYDRFMNEVVRSTSVPNPLKAFAICCKIWNHPDVLYNFLRKRSEANAAIEEDLDLEELGGVTKAGRARNSKNPPRRPGKPRGAPKKPAATIPPNTTTGPMVPRPDAPYGNAPYPPNGPYGPPQPYRPDQPGGAYPPYNYQNQGPGYYPPNQAYNQNYPGNYYPQQTPYDSNFPNQYPQNDPQNMNNQGYNQNYWGNGGNYYGNSGYYNNPQYPNGPPPDYRGNPPPDFENPQQYPPNYNPASSEQQPYPGNALQPYTNNQEQPGTSYGDQPRPPYQGSYQNAPGYNPEYNANAPPGPSYPNNQPPPGSGYPNNQPPPGTAYPNNQPPATSPYPNSQPPAGPTYPNNQPPPGYPNQPYPPPYSGSEAPYGTNPAAPYNQYENRPNFFKEESQVTVKSESSTAPGFPPAETKPSVASTPTVQNQYQNHSPYFGYSNNPGNQPQVKNESSNPSFQASEIKNETAPNATSAPYGNPGYNYNQPNLPGFPNQADGNTNGNYPFPAYPTLETKTPLGSNSSGSPLTTWPLESIKTEVDKLKAEEKTEMKSESDGEVKIADLDTKMIVKDDGKKPKEISSLAKDNTKKPQDKKEKKKGGKSDASDSEEDTSKKSKQKGGKGGKGKESKKGEKPRPRGRPRLAKGRKDRKTSKEKDDSESEESEKEEKLNREEELALVKKAEEVTYDWAAELLKDYIPGIIENSSKMELFFYLLNESIKMGDRILLFSQSLFTLNLIEDFLERNYIPGTNCLWERNTNYYRLDGSTHALEREKLINEFNANPHIYLFLVSTRAGSLGINLVGANRVIVFDASWNPCHDTQAVCRVYRYGQKKPCFVYRFVMDWCLEKKIYDRQINKQGMADRVVDECNPDAVLSMKEITNLCFDNDEKESEPKDLSEHKDKYLDILMQGIIQYHSNLLSKEPFQHESLLVDRKEKKLSSAEKRLAQRGYELEKKAALAPKPTTAYRTVRTADGSVVQRPVGTVRPMQHGARWIPADVWRRQGMTAQEMTLPLDVVIPTNSAEKTNIVLKAGQRVMVLKSPKGIYMQLESGKIIAIKTSFKGLGQKGAETKDNSPIGKKILGSRPGSIPGSLKNNSAITITSKSGPRPGYQRVLTRPSIIGHNKIARPLLPGQKIADIRNRLGEMRSYGAMRHRLAPHPGRILRPNLPGSLSITKIRKETKRSDNENSDSNPPKIGSEDDTQILDSDEEEDKAKDKPTSSEQRKPDAEHSEDSKSSTSSNKQKKSASNEKKPVEPIVLTTDEKLPPEEAFETKSSDANDAHFREDSRPPRMDSAPVMDSGPMMDNAPMMDNVERKKNPLKNYRHQRPGSRPQTESSLSILERTASVLNKEGMPDFRKNLDDITQSYSPGSEEKPGTKSKKKKSPNKESSESQPDRPFNAGMSHSVSSLLGSPGAAPKRDSMHNTAPVAPMGQGSMGLPLPGMSHEPLQSKMPLNMTASPMMGSPMADGKSPAQPYPAAGHPAAGPAPDAPYAQYPGYGMGYGSYPNPYYGYGNYPSYPPGYAPPAAAPAPPFPPAPPNDNYLPPNPQW